MMILKKTLGLTLLSFSILVSVLVLKPVLIQASEGPHVPAQGQEATTSETAQTGNNQHFFSMAVLLFGIGEFAGLIGKGVSHIHSTKREERQQVREQAKRQQLQKQKVLEREMLALLTYAEYKKGLYQEISSLVKLPYGLHTESAALDSK